MKTVEKYKDKLSKLKTEKRKACKSIKDGIYGKHSNNTKMKKIKEGFKAERRSIKRGEKNLVMKEVNEIVAATEKKTRKKRVVKVASNDIFPFNFFKEQK